MKWSFYPLKVHQIVYLFNDHYNFFSHFLFIIAGNQIHPAQHHPAVPLEDVVWLSDCMQNGQTFQEAIKVLRQNKFPDNYDPHPWFPGKNN